MRHLPAPHFAAAVCLVMLGLMAGAGITATPQEVRLRELPLAEEGETVVVTGIVVDLWKADSGTETLVLMDLSDNSSARMIWRMAGASPSPSTAVSIGDEIRACGEVSPSQVPPVLFVSGADFCLVRPSKIVLSVGTLADHWSVFEGDTISITGTLRYDSVSGLRLCDPTTQDSVAIRWTGDPNPLLGRAVHVTAIMRMDTRVLALILNVQEIEPSV